MTIIEEITTLRGNRIRRVKSSSIYLCGIVCLIAGLALIGYDDLRGGFLLLTAFPVLMLYPLVRLLLGGKDSVVAVATTVIVEEVLKGQVAKAINNKKDENKK